ncbi:hypothetical protein [Sinorhizobium medicae]|uniref:hypothetical protein n=1 Tax=Sinorhizobium medicae TaxID=110321 RepID=UPI0004095F22|nr:hypothetical protein [Sinorhizobium medicae]
MSIGTLHHAAIEAFNTASATVQPISHRTICTAFLDQNVELPLRLSETDIGVVLDRHGCDVFTVDVNNERPDEEALAIALFIVERVNEAALMPDLLPFRIHFEDPEIAPLDLDASDADYARQLDATLRGVPAGAIRKVKIIKDESRR